MSGFSNSEKHIILDRDGFTEMLTSNNDKIIVLKFGATWCGPCKRSKEFVYGKMRQMPENVLCLDIDVDDSFDLYAWMKSKKQVNGIPVLLAYYPGNTGPGSNLAISGTDEKQLNHFFDEVERASLTIKN